MNKTRTTAIHPQSDDMVESFNQTLQKHLAKVAVMHHKDLDHYIPLFLRSYRSALHDSTDFTPAKVIFGPEVRLTLDAVTGTPQMFQGQCQTT